MSFKAGVKTPGDQHFSFNGLRFKTPEEAEAYALDLKGRWTLVRATTVEPSDDPVNYAMVDGRAEQLLDTDFEKAA